MSNLIGTWEFESSENFDDFLKSLGVGILNRKAANTIKPTLVFKQNQEDASSWTFTIITSAKTTEIHFKDSVEFTEESNDGKKSKSVIRLESADKMVHEQRDPESGDLKITIIRELVGGKLVQRMIHKNVTAVRTFKRAA